MKGSKKDSSNRLGMFFSIALHAGLILLILYWGFSGSTQFSDNNPGPIQVSISGLDGGSANSKPPPPVKKSKPKPPEPEPTIGQKVSDIILIQVRWIQKRNFQASPHFKPIASNPSVVSFSRLSRSTVVTVLLKLMQS
mgnify:CR=1 FL=1